MKSEPEVEPSTGRADDRISLTMLKSDPDTLPAKSGPLFLRWPGRLVDLGTRTAPRYAGMSGTGHMVNFAHLGKVNEGA
jgi:hypothetical protein